MGFCAAHATAQGLEGVHAEVARRLAGPKPEQAVAHLAAVGAFDRWLVVDELRGQGRNDLTLPYAEAVPQAGVRSRLLAYLKALKPPNLGEQLVRALLARGRALLLEDRQRDALAVLPEAGKDLPPVLRARIDMARAYAGGSGTSEGARIAAEIGWSRYAYWAYSRTIFKQGNFLNWRVAAPQGTAVVCYGVAHGRLIGVWVTSGEFRFVPLAPSDQAKQVVGALRKLLVSGGPGVKKAAAEVRRELVAPLDLSPGVRSVYVATTPDLPAIPYSLVFSGHPVSECPAHGLTFNEFPKSEWSEEPGPPATGALCFGTHASELPLPDGKTWDGTQETTEGKLRLAANYRWRLIQVSLPYAPDEFRPASGDALPAVDLCLMHTDLLVVTDSAFPVRQRELVSYVAAYALEKLTELTEGHLTYTSRTPATPMRRLEKELQRKYERSTFWSADNPRMLVPLWKVGDDAARAFLGKFYEVWLGKEKATAEEALHAAQDFVRSQPKWSHPHYWAAWQLYQVPVPASPG